ncbi:hypothetical protein LCGC14_2897560, partial [marine sediment metagenome]
NSPAGIRNDLNIEFDWSDIKEN